MLAISDANPCGVQLTEIPAAVLDLTVRQTSAMLAQH